MIIYDELGQKNIPSDFESKNQWITESGLKDEFKDGREGEQLLRKLSDLINKYNNLSENNYKIQNIIGDILNRNVMQQSNFNLLSILSQIELYVIINANL